MGLHEIGAQLLLHLHNGGQLALHPLGLPCHGHKVIHLSALHGSRQFFVRHFLILCRTLFQVFRVHISKNGLGNLLFQALPLGFRKVFVLQFLYLGRGETKQVGEHLVALFPIEKGLFILAGGVLV